MKNGKYILIVAPPDYKGVLYRNRYCCEHHYVWWLNTGELIKPNEVIHHKDENSHNNLFSNLEKHTRSYHGYLHHKKSKIKLSFVCQNCGTTFVREGLKNYKFCSRRCIGLFGFNKK